MIDALYQQIGDELDAIQTPEEELAFDQKHIARVKKLSPEEAEAELAFLQNKLTSVEARVRKYLAEKQTQQNAIEV